MNKIITLTSFSYSYSHSWFFFTLIHCYKYPVNFTVASHVIHLLNKFGSQMLHAEILLLSTNLQICL
jgi:hypothetical protein